MTFAKIDHILVGVVVAFDAETGDVLHVQEKFVETLDGKPGCDTEISSSEREEVRANAARIFPRCKVDVTVGLPKLGQPESEPTIRYQVDPMTRELTMEHLRLE